MRTSEIVYEIFQNIIFRLKYLYEKTEISAYSYTCLYEIYDNPRFRRIHFYEKKKNMMVS